MGGWGRNRKKQTKQKANCCIPKMDHLRPLDKGKDNFQGMFEIEKWGLSSLSVLRLRIDKYCFLISAGKDGGLSPEL